MHIKSYNKKVKTSLWKKTGIGMTSNPQQMAQNKKRLRKQNRTTLNIHISPGFGGVGDQFLFGLLNSSELRTSTFNKFSHTKAMT
eukprot:3636194-Amphidinium_carterae.1